MQKLQLDAVLQQHAIINAGWAQLNAAILTQDKHATIIIQILAMNGALTQIASLDAIPILDNVRIILALE